MINLRPIAHNQQQYIYLEGQICFQLPGGWSSAGPNAPDSISISYYVQ